MNADLILELERLSMLAELRATPSVHGVYLVPLYGRYEIAAEIIQALGGQLVSGQRPQKSH